FRLPKADEMWDDLSITDRSNDRAGRIARGKVYPYPRLLGFVRIVGILLAKAANGRTARAIDDALAALTDDGSAARAQIAKLCAAGWKRAGLALPLACAKLIFAINRNRPAELAIRQSVKTVKADAAGALFSIDCSALTWAVIDSGIDADHPAFLRREKQPCGNPPRPSSRVRETYDFSYLRELLTTRDWTALPQHVRTALTLSETAEGDQDLKRKWVEMLSRIRRARLIDWELLRPFLRVNHGPDYVKPVDPHGTHVAGILAADWEREGDPMIGMCPTINLIDIRVCRDGGASDEFVIMSALQFIRHLNANGERMAVHGVNMSLSLKHDPAVYACGRTPVCEEAERTVAAGVVVVAAAGNHGYRRILSEGSVPFDQYCPVSITDPGNAENVITVGSTHRHEPHTYGVSYFSSRGPTGDGRIKPDLVAPGEKIFAPAPGEEAMRLDGTSMAAPHVSGAAAMLMARHVELVGQPQRIKRILCDTATDLGRERYFQGRGLVDVLRAIQSV
ncbi:MAG: S8 family serine peptidase, partial [Sphingomonadaceae bacterium]